MNRSNISSTLADRGDSVPPPSLSSSSPTISPLITSLENRRERPIMVMVVVLCYHHTPRPPQGLNSNFDSSTHLFLWLRRVPSMAAVTRACRSVSARAPSSISSENALFVVAW
jgi:hypothetical protein